MPQITTLFPTTALGLAMILMTGCADADVDPPASPAAALAQVSPSPTAQPEALKVLKLTGTACSTESTTSFYDTESKTLVLQFSEYSIDFSAEQPASTKNCAITLDVTFAKGLANALLRVQYRGYAVLPEGTSARLESSYAFTGLRQAAAPTTLRDPIPNLLQEPWAVVHDVTSSQPGVADCATRRTLTVPTNLILGNSKPGQDGHVDVESIELSMVPVAAGTRTCRGR